MLIACLVGRTAATKSLPLQPAASAVACPPLRRSSGDDLSARRVLTELLLQMTAISNRPSCLVYVFACTNRPDDCDPALLRRWVT